jgi:hypothetical protein
VIIVEKIILKYLGTLDQPLAKTMMETIRNGTEVVVEITPRFFSAWDFGGRIVFGGFSLKSSSD